MLCDYGCKQIAIYQFKNGKWCCSKSFNQCPYMKKRISKSHQGKIISEETKKKISNTEKGKIISEETKKRMRNSKLGKKNPFYGKTHKDITKKNMSEIAKKRIVSNKTKKKISKANIGKNNGMYGKHHNIETVKKISQANKGKISPNLGKKLSEETKIKISKANIGKIKTIETRLKMKISIEQIKVRSHLFSKVEEMRYKPGFEKEKIIQVHCKNHLCPNSKEQGGWFTPTGNQLDGRRRALEYGNEGGYFYCSEKCKQECPLYRVKTSTLIKQDKIRSGHLEDPWYTSEEYQEWRQHILELDDGLCVYCGQKATIVHHILPQKTHPESALDPTNGLSVCQKCHFKYGHRDSWCNTGKLSTLVCERIIRIKEK